MSLQNLRYTVFYKSNHFPESSPHLKELDFEFLLEYKDLVQIDATFQLNTHDKCPHRIGGRNILSPSLQYQNITISSIHHKIRLVSRSHWMVICLYHFWGCWIPYINYLVSKAYFPFLL